MTEEAPSTLPKPFVFVLMPFDPQFRDIYKFGIQGAATDVGAYAERVDDQNFTEGMLDRIFTQISKADVIVADMTGRNPNVFYEVGYAHALDKIVLLLTQDSNDIPFDLKHRQHTVYGGKIDVLRSELSKRLQWAIVESRRRVDRTPAEFISVQIHGKLIPAGIERDDPPDITGQVARTDRIFSISIHLRNDGADTLKDISHVYLFTEEAAVIVPGKEKHAYSNWLSGTTMAISGTFGETTPKDPTPEPLDSFLADSMDAPDGLTSRYRLPITFPALPPGAIEVAYLQLMFTKPTPYATVLYRLRLHTQTRYYDYRFRLTIRTEAGRAKDKGTESGATSRN